MTTHSNDVHTHGHGDGHSHSETLEQEFVPSSVMKYTERYKKPRVFVRAVESERYTLTEQQRELRASVPRLIRPTHRLRHQ